MVRKVFTQINEPVTQIDVVSLYITKKQELDQLKKEVDNLNNLLKQQMLDNNLKFVESNGYKVTKSESQRVNWKEDLLLAKVKTYNRPELIEQVETVNMSALEQCILDEHIDIQDLMDCQQTTTVTTLRISKVKENVDE